MSFRLPSNVGPLDRAVRLAAGAGLLTLAFTGPRSPWGYLGVILILTAAINFCPLYAALGLSSRRAT